MEEQGCAEEVRREEPLPPWQVGVRGGRCTPSGATAFTRARLGSFWSRLTLDEVSGALGDLGTLIPLLASCATAGSVRLGAALFWMGVFNVVSAFQWDIPMPVQPMKSIAAVTISDGLSPGALAAAGILTGGMVWILGVTQMIDVVNRLMAKSVIAGMQIGLGVKLASTGCSYWDQGGWVDDLDGKLTCLLCFVGTAFLLLRTKWPAALIIFSIGCIITGIKMAKAGKHLQLQVLELEATAPEGRDWLEGLLKGTLPQVPLTCLSSVIAVCCLSVDLFRDPLDGGKGVTRTSVATSIGLMNVVGCWFGAMPSCHGVGGLAGQYRFGARGGCSILMLGAAKILLSLTVGQSLNVAINYYPKVVLGVLLLFAGMELASVGAKVLLKSSSFEEDLLPCFVTAAAYIGTHNIALGIAAGVIAAAMQRLERWRELRQSILGDRALKEKPEGAPEDSDASASNSPTAGRT